MNETIIIWVSIIWLPLLMYVMLRNEARFKKNIAVGVTFPFEGRDDSQVEGILNSYKKNMAWVCFLLVAIAIPCVFIKSFKVTMILWGIWLDLCIVLPYIPYVYCNKKLKENKVKRGWVKSSNELTIDISAIPSSRWLSPWLFVPAVIICLLPMIWDRSYISLCLGLGLCNIFFWVSYRYLFRNKSEAVDDNQQLTQTLSRVRRHNWGVMWIICAYSLALLNLGMYLSRNNPTLAVVIVFAFTFIIVIAALRVEFKTRKVQENLTANSGRSWYIDDDDKWMGGVLYYNPNDSRLVVNYRVGINSTINLANPLGKIFFVLMILLLLSLPFLGVFIGQLGSSPIELDITETEVVVSNGNTTYSIPIDDITQVELLDKLPNNMVRTFGTGMENLLKGNFAVDDIGALKVCLDPKNAPFILIGTNDNKNYLIGSRDFELTSDVYHRLASMLEKSK